MLILERDWAQTGENWLKRHMPDGAELVQHGSELHLILTAECLDPEIPFEAQHDSARNALDRIISMKILAAKFVASTAQ